LYVRRTAWSQRVKKRRLTIMLILALAVCAIQLSDEVLDSDSGRVDEAILLFIHAHVPVDLTALFEGLSMTGSSIVLYPLTIVTVLGLLMARRRSEALLIAASVSGGAALVFLVKLVVGRTRPALWETEWYWGSSFPSGHTLVVAALAIAAALSVDRLWPRGRGLAWALALLWISLVAISRLVLGVHWPTDVVAAVCIGALLPLVMSVALEPLVAPGGRLKACQDL